MSEAKFIKKQPFVMFPINKSTSGYAYKNGNATINIQFSRNATRVLSSSSLRLCGRMNIVGKNASQMPANHFDMPGAIQASVDTYEQVCYIDDRTGVSCLLNYVQCGDLFGSS